MEIQVDAGHFSSQLTIFLFFFSFFINNVGTVVIYGIDFRVTEDAENQDWIGKGIFEKKMPVDDKSVLVH